MDAEIAELRTRVDEAERAYARVKLDMDRKRSGPKRRR
jgi:hypothetical protein